MSEVALFVDLENIVYSLRNLHGLGPDPTAWVAKALKYGPLAFARAYADFQQPAFRDFQARLSVAGIDSFNCPVKKTAAGEQGTVDLNVAIDLYEVALDRPGIDTFVLMAGDRDYIRIVGRLRNRLQKKIVVSGVPGSVSRDLVLAAGNEDPLEVAVLPVDEEKLIQLIAHYEDSRREGILPTFGYMADFAKHPQNSNIVPSTLVESKLHDFIERGILMQQQVALDSEKQIRTTRLDRTNEMVRRALRLAPASDGNEPALKPAPQLSS